MFLNLISVIVLQLPASGNESVDKLGEEVGSVFQRYGIELCDQCRSQFFESQKTVVFQFPCDKTIFAYFGAGSSREVHYFDCYLVSCVCSGSLDAFRGHWIHVSSTVRIWCRNSLRIECQMFFGASNRYSHSADSLSIKLTWSFELHIVSAISYTFNWWFDNIRSWNFVRLFFVVVVFTAPALGWTKT